MAKNKYSGDKSNAPARNNSQAVSNQRTWREGNKIVSEQAVGRYEHNGRNNWSKYESMSRNEVQIDRTGGRPGGQNNYVVTKTRYNVEVQTERREYSPREMNNKGGYLENKPSGRNSNNY
ncbi:hypothetical protein NEAUS04_1434 [Nematocida ausubeli]|uniref:Uncharacterized protein n=1 Tax=Nematocida ausubeli (strain ATCC PRA-371 / ERTm2) TaxID=1913371 RepID=A0A086J324_NEMA1|nr:uncharacterized protein NESG_00692 [Nematocida ausubeli]KAI5132994.1 hypothetical protein NEAUS06_0489 [Nematocida ausubeli]KAI5163221.1 hypothetical protein NEAUS04_1434 [Nematocida ausubeli]KFG26542.1 hypothetical protein NESG_00692 [Nematocida ausubeli]